MMDTIPSSMQQEIIVLFKKNKTVREIADVTGFDKQAILEFLTKEGYWSVNCSGCVVKRCYDCIGLYELGKPISIQDRINFIAEMKNDSNKT